MSDNETLDLTASRPGALATTQPQDESAQVMALFATALEKGTAGTEALAQLVELHDRVQRRRAELEFAANLVEFQSECPAVERTSTAKIATKSGAGFEYKFADFAEIVSTVRPFLARHGLSFTFDSKTDNRALTCVCTLRHANGHSVSSSFTLPTESASAMSEQQKIGAALTFAKRQSLVAVLGLSLTDPDPEGASSRDMTPISDDQAATLSALVEEVGADMGRFLRFLGVDSLGDLPASRYSSAVAGLENKRKAARP